MIDKSTLNGKPHPPEPAALTESPLAAAAAAQKPRPGARALGNAVHASVEDEMGIIAALAEALAPLLKPGPALKAVWEEWPDESEHVHTLNSAGQISAYNRARLEDLIHRLRL